MNAKKLLLIGLLMIGSGWVGVKIGEQNIKVAFKNWMPSVAINKETPAGLASGRKEVDFSLFWTVWDRVQKLYVDKAALDPKKMVDGAIFGMVAAIGDPYTVYLPVKENTETKQDLGGFFDGVGIQLGFKDNRIVVVSPLDGTPAFKAGVKAGDFILRIVDEKAGVDKTTDGMSLQEAVKLIRGQKKTYVKLTLARVGIEKSFTLDLMRDVINVKSATVEYKEKNGKKYAWIKLTRFGEKTQEEWNSAVSDVLSQQPAVAGVVLDLRNNPGGYLEGSVYIAGEFLKSGKLVVTQQMGDGTKDNSVVERNGRFLDIKTVVLINQGSASASEILSGALKDNKRAKIVGETSFGKGSVQQPEDFPDGSGVHVTIAKWLTPSGTWIDKNGITPDITVKMPETSTDDTLRPQLDKALEQF